MSDAKHSTQLDITAREYRIHMLPGRYPAAVPTALHWLAQEYLDDATPKNFWTWLQQSADAEAIIKMEMRRRAEGIRCDECGAPLASAEESRGIPPWTYCADCAHRDHMEDLMEVDG